MKKLLLLLITSLAFSTVTDIDGNVYETVLIGDQLWMAENLNVTHYNEGSEIPTDYSDFEWDELDDTETGAYAVCNDDLSNPYGNIYNWYAVDDSRGICPVGWHVPTDDEFKELEMFLGMSQEEADNIGYRGTNEGSKLAGNADLWSDGILDSSPEFGNSGFDAVPNGAKTDSGSYIKINEEGPIWTSSMSDLYNNPFQRNLSFIYTAIDRGTPDMGHGFAIRCLTNDYILGDINGDDTVNVLDVVSILAYILGSIEFNETEMYLADYNEDNDVNVLDVVMIVSFILGNIIH